MKNNMNWWTAIALHTDRELREKSAPRQLLSYGRVRSESGEFSMCRQRGTDGKPDGAHLGAAGCCSGDVGVLAQVLDLVDLYFFHDALFSVPAIGPQMLDGTHCSAGQPWQQ